MRRFEPIKAAALDKFVDEYNAQHAKGYHLVDFTFKYVDGEFIGILENYFVGAEELPHEYMAAEIGVTQRG